MFYLPLWTTTIVTVVTLHAVHVDGLYGRDAHSSATFGISRFYNPLFRVPLRFVGKRDGVENVDTGMKAHLDDSVDKRRVTVDAQTKLKILEKVLRDLRVLEADQDRDLRRLLERHKDQLARLFKLLPPYLDRRIFHTFLNSLMKRRFNPWGGKRDSDKRPSFSPWGGKKKRDDTETAIGGHDETSTVSSEIIKRFLSDMNDSFNVNDKRSFTKELPGPKAGDINLPGEHFSPDSDDGRPLHDVFDPDTSPEKETSFNILSQFGAELESLSQLQDDTKDDQIDENNNPTRRFKRGFNAWGGKRAYERQADEKRASFNPWGGKRSPNDLPVDKRTGFNAWGGKRDSSLKTEASTREHLYAGLPSVLNIEFDTFYPRK